MSMAKARIEIHRSAVGGGFYPEVAGGGFVTSHLSSTTVEEAIEAGLSAVRKELEQQLREGSSPHAVR